MDLLDSLSVRGKVTIMKKIVTTVIALILAFTTVLPMEASAASKDPLDPGEHLVKYAKKYLGSRYKRGGTYLKDLDKKGDKNRVDCTGFVQGIYKRYAKVKLPGGSLRRMERKAIKLGKKVGSYRKGLSKAKPGDILIFHPGSWRQHVSIYYGKKDGRHVVIEANSAAGGVTLRKLRNAPRSVIRMENVIRDNSDYYGRYLDKCEYNFEDNAESNFEE